MNIMNILVSGLFSAADSYGKGTATAEIIIMLLVAFILGYLLRYFLSDDSSDKLEYEELYQKYMYTKDELKKCKAALSAAQKEAPAPEQPVKQSLVKVPEPENIIKDDLKKIEGIGPKIEQLLYAEGIYTWDDLSKTAVQQIQIILDNAGPRFRVHNPESWPFQAGLAAEGKWEELNKWQDEHKGGRF